MVIDLRNKQPGDRHQKIEKFFKEPDLVVKEDSEEDKQLITEDYSQDALLHWQAPEFEPSQWDRRWYLIATLVLAAIVIFALVTNSPIMAITFILIGIVGYIFLQKKPRFLDFMITPDGIVVGDEIYEFRSIKSFWIFYEPHNIKVISLHMKGKLLPYIHIPIHDEDPVKIREILLEFITEVEQEPSLIDSIERVLRI